MYTNQFLGMEFTEEKNGVVFHFLNGNRLAEEYIFKKPEEATRFYMICLRFFDEFAEEDPVMQQDMFRSFLKNNLMKMKYLKRVY
ncbi:hypothetical protein [Jeotgalibaca caeni]|uniref:hypothetical protein n=1 Tax=Jeotgalibaca caeni TaxID=3028623 RepID=UPI00237D9131|nr:hypothetical protein [Jeotgalibaca caeni]MDE1548176.1 hypothetical protein [Jeotgalibaca caeni]